MVESAGGDAWGVGRQGCRPGSRGVWTAAEVEGRRVCVGDGEDDQVIPEHRSTAAADRLAALGAAVTHETYPTGHGIGRDELADVVSFVESSLQ